MELRLTTDGSAAKEFSVSLTQVYEQVEQSELQ